MERLYCRHINDNKHGRKLPGNMPGIFELKRGIERLFIPLGILAVVFRAIGPGISVPMKCVPCHFSGEADLVYTLTSAYTDALSKYFTDRTPGNPPAVYRAYKVARDREYLRTREKTGLRTAPGFGYFFMSGIYQFYMYPCPDRRKAHGEF
jgi:hypothetical protein